MTLNPSVAVRTVALVLCLLSFSLSMHAQSRLLDSFDSTAGWHVIVSEGAGLTLSSVPGKTGNALAMQFDLSKVSGYVIARKDFSVDLPDNYQFIFDMRADAPVNNFEFKVMDENENVHWIKKLNITYPKDVDPPAHQETPSHICVGTETGRTSPFRARHRVRCLCRERRQGNGVHR